MTFYIYYCSGNQEIRTLRHGVDDWSVRSSGCPMAESPMIDLIHHWSFMGVVNCGDRMISIMMDLDLQSGLV